MRDTLGEDRASHEPFAALNSDFKAFGSKKSCLREQNEALKDTFVLIHVQFKA